MFFFVFLIQKIKKIIKYYFFIYLYNYKDFYKKVINNFFYNKSTHFLR